MSFCFHRRVNEAELSFSMLYFSSEWFPALFHHASKKARSKARETASQMRSRVPKELYPDGPLEDVERAKRVMVEEKL